MTYADDTALGPDRAATAARILSDVLAPANTVFLICLLSGLASSDSTRIGLAWGTMLGAFCALIPMATIHLGVRLDRLTDRHVTRRGQRRPVFLMCAGSVMCGVLVTLLLDAPNLLIWILVTMVGGLVTAGGVTLLGPKVSMHAFCLTSLNMLLAMLFSPWWLTALLVAVPLVAFARLRIKHHTPLEVTLGVGLGLLVMLVAQPLMPTPR